MKNLKRIMLALSLILVVNMAAKAEVGYINYQKVLENYPAAQQAIKEIDAKGLELQQYMVDKEKQYKSLDTPLKKQNFQTQTQSEFRAKEEALYKLQSAKEEQILNQIQTAARAVMVSQKLDAILADNVVFVGGIDITDLVLQKLKGQ